ncbi:MAG: hypothetical protein AAF364_20475, partial [Pseudomonadota bacterium]
KNMIFGRSPAVNRAISVCSYLAGFAVSVVNVVYTKLYFESFLARQDTSLIWWTVWLIASVMGLYEAFCIGLLTTPIAWGVIFSIPSSLAKIQNEMQRKIAVYASGALATALLLFCVLVYWIDYTTTIGGLGMGDTLSARFLAGCLVFGSEVMFLAGNALAWLALISKAGTEKEKKKYEDAIRNGASSSGSVSLK